MHLQTAFLAFAAIFSTATAICCKGPPNCGTVFNECVDACVAEGKSEADCGKGPCYGGAVSDSFLKSWISELQALILSSWVAPTHVMPIVEHPT
jgi:hypothetical protein